MGRDEDKHWNDVQRQRERNEPRRRDDATGTEALLRPNNEGHDAERLRDRLEHWAAEEGPAGRDTRKLRRMEEQERAQAGAPGAEVPTAGSRQERQGRFAEAGPEHGKASGGGEPKKHPKPREETTPEPGRGANVGGNGTMPGEPPRLDVGPGGEVRYVHGQERRPKSKQGT